jgi:hypothetical protein
MAGSLLHVLPVQLSFQRLRCDLPALLWSSRWIRATQHPRTQQKTPKLTKWGVCRMGQEWGFRLQVEQWPAESTWRNPNVYYDMNGPPSPSRTRAGSCYCVDRQHCLSPNETHISVDQHEEHNRDVGFMPSGFPKRMLGQGVCFITAGPITKLFAWGEEESGGQVL